MLFPIRPSSPAFGCKSRAERLGLWCKHLACFVHHSRLPSWWSPPSTNDCLPDKPEVHRCLPGTHSLFFVSKDFPPKLKKKSFASNPVPVHALILAAHLTGVSASIQVPSTQHVLCHCTSIHNGAVTQWSFNDVDSDLHQIIRDTACIGKKTQFIYLFFVSACSLIILQLANRSNRLPYAMLGHYDSSCLLLIIVHSYFPCSSRPFNEPSTLNCLHGCVKRTGNSAGGPVIESLWKFLCGAWSQKHWTST